MVCRFKIVYYEFLNFYEICRKRENLQYKSVDEIFLFLMIKIEMLVHYEIDLHLGDAVINQSIQKINIPIWYYGIQIWGSSKPSNVRTIQAFHTHSNPIIKQLSSKEIPGNPSRRLKSGVRQLRRIWDTTLYSIHLLHRYQKVFYLASSALLYCEAIKNILNKWSNIIFHFAMSNNLSSRCNTQIVLISYYTRLYDNIFKNQSAQLTYTIYNIEISIGAIDVYPFPIP
ncbi:putative RNA-directed DNA polymerase [Aphis craccivora]|uniref:Putative RNA-directed DNA polymerase n=1 Tax=Aphis craccivora TaxID=307492 RepID=A0A6G0Z808_APHCR|nr:putative RNA-directed DNA polymerase [Aphis craccivora]